MEQISEYVFNINDPVIFQTALIIMFSMLTWSWMLSEWLTRKFEKWMSKKKEKQNG